MIRLGAFEVHEPVGKGATGIVWRASHDGLPVAIKVLNAQAARKPEIVAAFHHELRAVARLDHPAVAMVLDVGEIPEEAAAKSHGRMVAGSPWFALEWAGAGTLYQPANQPDSWPQLERLLRRLLDGLAHAHARGVVHRDLKLQNLLVGAPEDPRPGPKIADFGIAFSSESLVPAGYESAGTALYMAPEQVRGDWRAFGPWTDLYALGGVAWRLATGRPTFPGLAGTALLRAQLETEADAFVPRYPVPAGFEAWIRCCLRKDRRARFACAADATWGLARLGRASLGPAAPVPAEADEAPTDTAAPLSSEVPAANPDRPPRPPFPTSWRSRALPVAPLRLQKAGLKLLALRRPPFVGRETAFDVAWRALGRVVADGRPQAVAITGPAGVGRSRFAEAVAERAHEVGAAAVLAVDASRPGTLARLVAAATGTGGLAPADRAARIAQLTAATGGRDEALEAALQGGTDAVAAAQLLDRLVAAERPLVVVLDDVQGDPEARVGSVTGRPPDPAARPP